MQIFKALLPTMVLTGALAAASFTPLAAADPAAPPPPPPANGGSMGPMGDHADHGGPHWGEHERDRQWGHDHREPMMHLLHKLDLSDAQKNQLKAVFEKTRTDMKALETKERSTHESLIGLSPKDPAFGTLVETEKSTAAARVQLFADSWTSVYGILTPAQQAKIPAILAEEKNARAAHEAEWKAHHEAH